MNINPDNITATPTPAMIPFLIIAIGFTIWASTRTIDKLINQVMTICVYGFRMGRVVRDRRRLFTTAEKRIISARAGGRCEHKHPLWIRCLRPGAHADHVLPWSKGGPTHPSNGAWLCARHNLRKSNLYPSPVYVWRLERRRRRAALRAAHRRLRTTLPENTHDQPYAPR